MIRVGDLDDEIAKIFSGYEAEAKAGVVRAVSRTAKAVNSEIKQHATFHDRTGQYRKAFALYKAGDKKTKYSEIWYVKPPHYRFTHLLERSHKTRSGGGSKAFPHIEYGEKLAQGMLPEEIEKELST